MSGGSRLIVKNLPNSVTSDKLKTAFASKGEVTDVQLKYTKDKKFRHFGFVGFKTEGAAEAAVKHFHNTFMGATKISVEFCADWGAGEGAKPRAWSKYSADSSAYANANKKAEQPAAAADENDNKKEAKLVKKERKKAKQAQVDALLLKYKDDPKFQEFMRVHKRNSEKWNNDAILEIGQTYNQDASEIHKEDKKADSDSDVEQDSGNVEDKVAFDTKLSDLDYLKSLSGATGVEENTGGTKTAPKDKTKKKKEHKNEDYFTVKLTNLPYNAKKKDVKNFLQPLKAKSIRVPRQIKGIAYAGFATEKEMKKALNKSKSFMGTKQIGVIWYTNNQAKSNQTAQTEARWRAQEDGLKNEETIAESGRLFVRNLPYTAQEEELEELFKPFGPLAEVNLPIDKNTRKIKGFAFITYVIPENAVQAFTKLDGTTFQGRLLHLIPGKAKQSEEELAEGVAGMEGMSSYKREKAAKEKASAGSSHNWNTLFLGASAVADLMADKYGVDKKDVVLGTDSTSSSAAVRLALGETQIVADTKKFLEEQGLSLDAFTPAGKKAGDSAKRSKTVIVVKNLPVTTSAEEVRDKFAPFGQLGRVVLPPKGVTAVVEFHEPTEARAAFKKLAYTKFKAGTPLYLEWGPENAFKAAHVQPEPLEPSDNDKIVPEAKSIDDDTPEAETTLFVKNLSFETVDSELRAHFETVGRVHSATVATKKDPKAVGASLSMGYGFVQFYRRADASEALKTIQNKALNGHCLELKRSNRIEGHNQQQQGDNKMSGGHKPSPKMVVRNVPFEASQREIEDVFKTFGQLKAVRLPKKVTGSHRGFAFVEFHTAEEAKKAFEALCHSTHLYGRRLVLEWADAKDEETTIGDLRAKTANSYGEPAAKRLKKSDIAESLVLGK